MLGRKAQRVEEGGLRPSLVDACRDPDPLRRLVLAAAPLAVAVAVAVTACVFVSPLSRFLLEPSDVFHDHLPPPPHKANEPTGGEIKMPGGRKRLPVQRWVAAGTPTQATCVCVARDTSPDPCPQAFSLSHHKLLASGALGWCA